MEIAKSTTSNDTYVLPNRGGGQPSVRLMTQHWLYKDHFGWNIHPSIRASFSSSQAVRMADIGTGNAIFLLEEHPLLPPGSQSFGLDISPTMFPSPSTLPPGITLRTLDAASSVPHDLRGTFDIVNIRLLVGAITNNDPTTVLHNALSLLKPGGYIQWTEVFTPTNILASPSLPRQNTLSNPARKLLDPLLDSIGMHDWETSWMNHLPEIFNQTGLQDIEVVDLGSPRKEMWSSWGSNTLAYLRESVESSDDVVREEILEELEEDYASGVYIASDPRVVVGRKPLRAKL